MTLIDTRGNVHRMAGSPGAGQFVGRARNAPAGGLLPEAPTDDELGAAQAQIELRAGEREISDETARIAVLDLLHNHEACVARSESFTALTNCLRSGRADDIDQIHAELGSLYGSSSPARRQRIDALFTWSLQGGDNT